MNLNSLCCAKRPGHFRTELDSITNLVIYLNKYHNQIQFPKIFSVEYGFATGKKLIILEHQSDPFNKFYFTLGLPDDQYFFTLSGWKKNKFRTCINARTFFATMDVPNGIKTKLLKSKQYLEKGETGFNLKVKPYSYGGRILFEGDLREVYLAK